MFPAWPANCPVIVLTSCYPMAAPEPPIYLDNLASTPLAPQVLEAMMPWFIEHYANPHSLTHEPGRRAHKIVEKARAEIASAVHADPRSLIFTSGATEANNIALRGVAAAASRERRRILVSRIEHKSVLETAHSLRDSQFRIATIKVGKDGLVDLDALYKMLNEQTLLVSVMAVNNETGMIQPVSEIAEVCRSRGVLFHADCAQALGKIPLNVEAVSADLISLSSHKAYGPKGIGALYIRRRPRVPIKAILSGGSQEHGLRPGTLPVPLCVGFGAACRLVSENIEQDQKRITRLTNKLYHGILRIYPEAKLNGHPVLRVGGALNIFFPGAYANDLMRAFDGLAASSGSACTVTSFKPSHVLKAMGLTDTQADCSLRFGIGRYTTEQEISQALEIMTFGLESLGLGNARMVG